MIKKRIVKLLNCFIAFNNRLGFTLVEIIVVIAIIGILTSFLVANFANVKRTTRDAQRKSDLRGIQGALEIYRSDKGGYPATADLPLGSCGTLWVVSGITYIQTIPCDPLYDPATNYKYNYIFSAPSGNYDLIACLENTDDQQKDASNNATYCSGTGNWSFTLKNP